MKGKVKVQVGEDVLFQDIDDFIGYVKRAPKHFIDCCEKGVYADAYRDRDLVVEILHSLDFDSFEDERLYSIILKGCAKEVLRQEKRRNPNMNEDEEKDFEDSQYNALCVIAEDCKEVQNIIKENRNAYNEEDKSFDK